MLKRISAIVDDRNNEVIVPNDIVIPLGHEEAKEIMFPRIIAALTSGRKITAIKLFRSMSDCSLKDAKAAIDLLDMALKPYRALAEDLTRATDSSIHDLNA
jgi:ribosomal protein L7/L12